MGAKVDAGAVNIFYGTASGLPTYGQTLLQGHPEAGDRFGASLVVPMFSLAGGNGDEQPDLVVGAPGEDVGAKVDAGAANVFVNTTGTLSSTSGQMLLQDHPEARDRLGAALGS